jgi:hypothetical protein
MRTSALKTVYASSTPWTTAKPLCQACLGLSSRWLHASQARRLARVDELKELRPVQDVWFNGTHTASLPLDGSSNSLDRRAPNERTLKLGKSMIFYLSSIEHIMLTKVYSHSHPPVQTPHTLDDASTARDSISPNYTPALPFHASASTHSQWQNRLYCCVVDKPRSLGTHASSGQREVDRSQ